MQGASEREREAHGVLHRRIAELLAELTGAPPSNRWRCEGCRQLQPLREFRLCGCALLCHRCAEAGTGLTGDTCRPPHADAQVEPVPRSDQRAP